MRTARIIRAGFAALFAAALIPLSPYGVTRAHAADPAAATATATWLRSQLSDGRVYVNQQYNFDDLGLSTDILFAQAATGAPTARTTAIANQLAARSGDYTTSGDSVFAGATGKLLLAAAVARIDPTKVGGRDLRAQALTTVSDTGRVKDVTTGENYANVLSQSYVMLGLARTGQLPQKTVDYLVSQQCATGHYPLTLSDGPRACTEQDAPDTDATALAIMALKAAKPAPGSPAQAALDKALAWLVGAQDPNSGGWRGGVTTADLNTNSTGLATAALAGTSYQTARDRAATFVAAHRLSEGADAGAIAYNQAGKQAGVDANRDQWIRASAQAVLALAPVGLETLQLAPLDAGAYVPVASFRVADTRTTAKVAPNADLTVTVAGVQGLANQVGAVVLNLTVTEPEADGYISAYPKGVDAPTASSLNFVAGQTIPNLVVAQASPDGQIVLRNASPGASHLVADVVGYLTPGEATVAGMTSTAAPQRILDTRPNSTLAANSSRELVVAGRHEVPDNAAAVVLNLTVTNPQAPGYLSVGAAGSPAPTTSSLNFLPGETRPNLVVARLGEGGRIVITNTSPGSSDVVADLVGYVVGGQVNRSGGYQAIDGVRVYDGVAAQQPLANRSVPVTLPGSGAFAAVMTNLTAAAPTAPGYLALVRGGSRYPARTSTVNFTTAVPSSNAALAETSEAGQVDIHHASTGTAYALLDHVGGFRA